MSTTTTSSPTTLAPERNFSEPHQPAELLPADVHRLKTTMVNLYLVGMPGTTKWVLIDAGLPRNAKKIASAATEFFGDNPPQAIILTHGHFDHVGSLQKLLERWPTVPVYAHELELPYLTGRSDYPPPDPSVGGGMLARTSFMLPRHCYDFRPRIRALPRDNTVPEMPGWRWVHTPGHSPGHVSLFRDQDRALIVGDAFCTQKQESLLAVMSEKVQIHGPPMYFTIDWPAAKASVQRLNDLRPNVAFPGHGQPMANPRLAHDLNMLAKNFDEMAVPEKGRYVQQAARTNALGVTSMPPVDTERGPGPYLIGSFVAGFAAATAVQIYRNMTHGRRKREEMERIREEKFRREAPVSYRVFRGVRKAKEATASAGRRVRSWWEAMTS
jgi:glyoxylase-like metal-dependent hydrolase (beta-lactamase superfamily II)